jgi:hypothetical protein
MMENSQICFINTVLMILTGFVITMHVDLQGLMFGYSVKERHKLLVTKSVPPLCCSAFSRNSTATQNITV